MKTAILFSGQGAQSVGMGKDLAERYPRCRDLYARADAALGRGLSDVCFNGPEEDLTRSDNCQPAIFATSMACLTAVQAEGVGDDFACAAGLSLGEWTALHMAGVLDFDDTVRVLDARGRFMQEACEATAGGMVSIIGLSREELDRICAETGVTVANLNSAQQTVLSGAREGIERASGLAEAAGAKRSVVLKVAGAFHSPLMAPAAEKLAAVLEKVTFRAPRIPVPANVTGRPHGDADTIAGVMLRQVTETVCWEADVSWMAAQGVDTFVECGPGRVLTGLVKRIARGVALHNVQDTASAQSVAAALGKEQA